MKNNTLRNIIVIAVAMLLAGAGVFYSIYRGRVSEIPTGTIGNTAGNLNNEGLFAEAGGKVYFSNPYDNGALYVMNPDCTGLERLNDMSARYVNVGGNFVFFCGKPNDTTSGLGGMVARPGMYRVDLKTGKIKSMTKDATQSMILVDNNIYYQHYTKSDSATFAKISLNTKESEDLLDFLVNPACYSNGKIYYNGMYDDHYLYAYDINTGENVSIWEGNIWNPILQDGYVYYMDVLNDYRLCRYNTSENTIEVLTKDRVDFFNVYNDYIYYQKSSSSTPALKRMRTDGSENMEIIAGVYKNINITSTYVYFSAFGSDVPLYRTPTAGLPDVTEFLEARDAVLLQ